VLCSIISLIARAIYVTLWTGRRFGLFLLLSKDEKERKWVKSDTRCRNLILIDRVPVIHSSKFIQFLHYYYTVYIRQSISKFILEEIIIWSFIFFLSQIWQAKGSRRNSWTCKRIHQHHAVLGLPERIYSTGRPQSWVLLTAPIQEGCSLLISISLLTIPLNLQKWTFRQRWAGVYRMTATFISFYCSIYPSLVFQLLLCNHDLPCFCVVVFG
jgi:hypothetical protein